MIAGAPECRRSWTLHNDYNWKKVYANGPYGKEVLVINTEE